MENFTTCQIAELPALVADCQTRKNKTKASIAGFVTNVTEGASKGGRPMSRMTVEDYSGR